METNPAGHGPADATETRISMGPGEMWVLVLGAAALAGPILWAVPMLTQWATASLPWLPVQGPLRLVTAAGDATPGWARLVVGSVIGAVVGLGLALAATVITVSDRAIVIAKGASRVRLARSQVHEATIESKHLVLRDRADVELSYDKVDGDLDWLAEALVRHGWRDTPAPHR